MKKTIVTLLAVLSACILIAQSPQAFKYQAVARDNTGEILANQNISLQISILQGSTTGVSVYVETHDTITNEFGLVNLEIGNGEVVSGDFTSINWGDNSYFLQVELDEEGGTDYQVMGTTQLLAVPYALYSESTGDTSRWRRNIDDLYYLDGKLGIGTISPQYNLDIYGNTTGQSRLRLTNPDNSKILLFGSGNDLFSSSITFQGGDALRFMRYDGGYIELMRIQDNGTIGIGTDTPEESALLELSSDSKGFLLPRLLNGQILGMSSPTEGLVVYNTNSHELNVFNGTRWLTMCGDDVLLEIGDRYQGGIIAYILQVGDPGYDENLQHGLIAALNDYSSSIQWYNGSYTTTGATGTAIGTGQANTMAVVANQGAGSYAAQVCDDFDEGTYNDWFLPSADELNQLYLNKSSIDSTALAHGGTAFGSYVFWSSTEENNNEAVGWIFSTGYDYLFGKDITLHIRAVRAF